MVKLLFSSSDTLIGKTIRATTDSEWNHVDVLIDDKWLIGATTEGVVYCTLAQRVSESASHEVVELDIDRGFIEAVTAEFGKPYDYLGAVCSIFSLPHNWQDDRRWFCSELIAAMAKKHGVVLADSKSWHVTPGMLYEAVKSRLTIVSHR